MTTKSLASIRWKPDYDTGNVMVDGQHRDLIDLVNLLVAADRNDEGAVVLIAAFDALQRYVTRHFSEEEELLEAANSPYLEEHRTHHSVLMRELATLWKLDRDIPVKQVVHELAQWGEYRLLKHFLTIDSKTFREPPFAE